MKRKIIIWMFVLALITFFLFGLKYETTIYLGMSSPTSDGYSIDAEVKVDGEVITKDSINNNPYKYKTIKKTLGIGFRKVEVLSERADAYSVRTIFVLPNQHVLIEFYPGIQNLRKVPEFDISYGFNPFRYE
ncbi:hypothetical protein FAZ19_09720 [Sphingobacterium alkalisoli]|uniref:Uncharacterized protein n=1 Tax=Sphingobacterium alkalisoli TaxID=1874115 RepID=A0A4U0H1T9_9SPHI|nr:hypothetical protein [Sphingobacterium alkalisoli]TJY65418.1 hypothetical protein FAZ19_09720 [Sphingobacterium alkalisoli]